MKCLLLDIEMPIGNVCPSAYNEDGFKCYEGCGCADNPELINEQVKNWEKFKKGELGEKKLGEKKLGEKKLGEKKLGEKKLGEKKDGLELEKIGTRTLTGTYIIEGNLAYIEQEEKGKVTVVTASGIRETIPIGELEKFIKTRDTSSEIREELEMLTSDILRKIEEK